MKGILAGALALMTAITLAGCDAKKEPTLDGAPSAANTPAATPLAATPPDASAMATPAAAPQAAAPAGMDVMGPAAGKWSLTSTMVGLKMPSTKPLEMCVAKQLSWKDAQDQQEAGTTCSDMSFTREGDSVHGHSVCTRKDGTKTETTFTITGDVSKAYTIETSMMRTPAPKAGPNPLIVKVSATRLGDC